MADLLINEQTEDCRQDCGKASGGEPRYSEEPYPEAVRIRQQRSLVVKEIQIRCFVLKHKSRCQHIKAFVSINKSVASDEQEKAQQKQENGRE